MSIRLKLILVSSIVISFAGCLACYAVRAISSSSELVVRMYDEPLMGINQARAAHARLIGAAVQMQRAMAFREAPGRAADELEKTILSAIEDLQVVRERVHSPEVRSAVDGAQLTARKWLDAGLAILRPRPGGRTELPTTFAVAKLGDQVVAAVDDLVELAAAYGFDFRERAEAATSTARKEMIALSVGTGFVSWIVALTLAYPLTKPIQAAIRIAANVASGDFTDEIQVSRRDDLGRLLQSLGTMQASLKARAQEQAESAAAKERMHAEQEKLRHDVTSNLPAAFEGKVGRLVLGLESAATELEPT